MTALLTYRSNARDTLRAAYIGTVRIGYVEERASFTQPGWRWQLILLRPEGGAYWGVEDDEADAKTELEKAFAHWMASAGLTTTIKETNDGGPGNSSVARSSTKRNPTARQRTAKSPADVGGDGADRPKANSGRTTGTAVHRTGKVRKR